MILSIFTPLWLFNGGWLTDFQGSFICIDIIFFIWFLMVAVEIPLVFLTGSERVRQRESWVAAVGSSVLLMCSWLLVKITVHGTLRAIYNADGISSISIWQKDASFLKPLGLTLMMRNFQNPLDSVWFEEKQYGLNDLFE